MAEPAPHAPLVVVDYADLKDPERIGFMLESVEKAFGSNGFGIIAIRNVPAFSEAKEAFLPKAHELQGLPKVYLEDKLTDPGSLYNAGWSHGKEKLGDQPDTAKGSFYFNPITDRPGTPDDRAKYPLAYPTNIWPTEQIPDFESKAKTIGIILKDVATLVAVHIDRLAQKKVTDYPENLVYHAMRETEKAKGRLLYYFPLDDTAKPSEDSWIGWHNDSGFITALAGDMYVNHQTGQLVDCPDPNAGLYVVDRNDETRRVEIPTDCLAIQIGECTQIVTGGAVTATPHCVQGAAVPNVARIALPVFVDTSPTFALAMPPGCTRAQVLEAGAKSKRVPPLSERWTTNGMSFGDFLAETFQMYYDWNRL